MDQGLLEIVKFLEAKWPYFTFPAILVWTGIKRYWVFGYQINDLRAQLEYERDGFAKRERKLESEAREWRELALRLRSLSERSIDVAATVQQLPPKAEQ